MLSKSHPIILFVDRLGFSLYQDTLANVLKFNFTSDLVANMDVISRAQLISLVATLIQINKIVSSDIAIILSDDVIYIKDLAVPAQKPPLAPPVLTPVPVQAPAPKTEGAEDKECKDEVESFLENIPFEEVLARVIKTESMNRVVAVNKDLVMSIVDAFVTKGSNLDTIVPAFIYGQNINFTAGLTPGNVKTVLGNIEILKSGNLLTDQEKIILFRNLKGQTEALPTSVAKKPQNRRQYLLAGVFVILLIILGVVYVTSQGSNGNSQPQTAVAPNVQTIVPTAVPTVVPAIATSSATVIPTDLKTVNIIISHSAQSSVIATSLKTGLSNMGFQNVTDQVLEVSIPEKSSVVFSQNISADLRSSIIAELKEVLPNFSVLENQDSNSTVNISIGKS